MSIDKIEVVACVDGNDVCPLMMSDNEVGNWCSITDAEVGTVAPKSCPLRKGPITISLAEDDS